MQDIGPAHLTKKALLHYTLDSTFQPHLQKDYRHTFLWESSELVRILNKFGFRVDIVDRTNTNWMPKDDYDLLISNASGNSGKLYPTYAKLTPRATKVFYALGPEPLHANERTLQRYDFAGQRTGNDVSAMRVMDKVDINSCMKISDAIIVLDDNGYSSSTYSSYKLPIYWVSPSSSPKALYETSFIRKRKRNTFLAFAGNGFIAKGMDLLVEAFENLPDCNLIIAGPHSDKTFWYLYGTRIQNADNISYEGFLTIGDEKYNRFVSQCSYVIAPVASEGVCTSVTTCMCSGLVPIVPHESGVDISSTGRYLTSDMMTLTDDIIEIVGQYSKLSDKEYAQKVSATLLKSQDFSQASFTKSWSIALANVLCDIEKLAE
ncbi:glycosyltransferase [Candidatus Terasakiella magnetica]|nr:glycosyltransferase [Candidatus Terasakiella magnetica]